MMRMVRGADGDGGCGFGGEVMMMYRRWIDGGSMVGMAWSGGGMGGGYAGFWPEYQWRRRNLKRGW
ncbi:hypothetical protein Tco_1433222, partial [Tanacetum coccineum]